MKKKLTELRITSMVTDIVPRERMMLKGGSTRLNMCKSYMGGSGCELYCDEPPPDQ